MKFMSRVSAVLRTGPVKYMGVGPLGPLRKRNFIDCPTAEFAKFIKSARPRDMPNVIDICNLIAIHRWRCLQSNGQFFVKFSGPSHWRRAGLPLTVQQATRFGIREWATWVGVVNVSRILGDSVRQLTARFEKLRTKSLSCTSKQNQCTFWKRATRREEFNSVESAFRSNQDCRRLPKSGKL